MIVAIESFVNPPEIVHAFMRFKEFWRDHAERSPDDFPSQLEMYHWYIAYMAWVILHATPPAKERATAKEWQDSRVGVPDHVKPLADLNARRGFLVMVGTVAMVLNLSGFDQAAVEFVSHAHHMDFDTGQLHMLAFDYVNSVSKIDAPVEE